MLFQLLLTLLLADLALAAKFTWPINKRKSVKSQLIKQGKWPQMAAMRRLYKNTTLMGDSIPIYDYLEAEYCLIATVGTPGKKFNALFDTSSDISWIISNTCGNKKSDCPSYCKGQYCDLLCEEECCSGNDDIACKDKEKFDPKNSSTYQTSYGTFQRYTTIGKIEGAYATDKWTIGSQNVTALALNNYRFGLATSLGDKFQTYALDGVFGLGRGLNPKSFIVDAIEKNLLDEPLVSIYFKDLGYNQNGKVGGAVTFGGIDNEHCGIVLDFVPLTSTYQWEFRIASGNLNGNYARGGLAITDTGSAYIHLPYSYLYQFTSSVGATYDYYNSIYKVNCTVDFTFAITIGKREYKIDKKHLINEYQPNKCELMVDQTGYWDEHDWILGVPFAEAYCQIFDFSGKLGLAATTP
ncbi:unnamed protein product [Bursaphelenchus okinawaensis]|uniref:Peptidase A1 domain-containing protein n=1 Tax=Bursaphelenchus okinawaensis TaxID=465554 RepID=A0A811L0G6_9BILA|nr:unnamed protein product [Bursaphelenchus okinawaensis]CAG9115445.1 unnamed protein product [Bursaphelenchus okinawaensis]